MKAVKKVLEDDESTKQIFSYKQIELESLIATSKAKWRINQLIENAEYQGKDYSHIPEDLKTYFSGTLSEDGNAHISNIRNIYSSIPDNCEEMDKLLKERIKYMLDYADFDLSEGVLTKLEEYENALSVNNRGYHPHYKRDVSETMVNTYNPEWISAWNGNMDIQLCLDFFAVITYISDYYSKDDSGTMDILLNALQDVQNEDLRTKLKKVGSVFLTHRQIGESEAYYRILPHMHLKDSNIEAVFAPTGFNPSRFLQRVDDDVADQCKNAIEVEGREGKYQEKASMYEKYLRRDCELQPEIKDLCNAQFVKKILKCKKDSRKI